MSNQGPIPRVLARLLALSLLAVGTVATAAVPASAEPQPGPVAIKQTDSTVRQSNSAPEYIVRFRPGAARSETAAARATGISVARELTLIPGMVVRLRDAQRTALAKNPNVVSIEPSARQTATTGGVQDPSPWGLDRIDQPSLPLNGQYSYANSGGGVTVYIVDTGIAPHTQFGDRVAAGAFTVSDGRRASDCNGHGTHVAGSVGGSTYGVAKNARLVPVRVLDCDGVGSSGDTIAALDWIAQTHSGGPAVVNMSLGGGYSAALNQAVAALTNRGITVVVAAGNERTDACYRSPASAATAITVAASDVADRQASFSNYGRCVDLFAPGANIRSAWIGSTTATAQISGTSMATPHVAGAAARLLQANPGWSPAQVAQALIAQATTGRITNITTGTPNRLLQLPAAPPRPLASIGSPTLVGTAKVGQRLSVTVGTWGPAPVSFNYQWYRTTATGTSAIAGALGPTYVVQPADRGATLRVYVKGSKPGYVAVTRASNVSRTVLPGTITVPTMTIGGHARVGASLWTNTGTWGPAPVTLRLQWYRVNSAGKYTAITGATAATYRPTTADLGYRLRLSVTGMKTGYTSRSQWGPLTYTITRGHLTAPRPAVRGTLRVNSTLGASAAWGPAPVTAKFQWYRITPRGPIAIHRATGASYRLTAADRGRRI